MTNQYRPEVDGLRALAVLPVILFHAGLPWMPGGYVGVDVFFVISGYLITRILMDELNVGRFSLARFYERRARRILPALLLVIGCTLIPALLLMSPGALKSFAVSVPTVLGFGSNIWFWLDSDYFAAAAETKPLLHTWSLAVEEQFYLLFPLLLLLVHRTLSANRTTRALLIITGLAWIISLLGSCWAVSRMPAAAFYLAPFRAWELLTGALLVLLRPSLVRIENRPANWLSLLGLLAVGWSTIGLEKSTPFPGLWALPPVLGTAMIIAFARPGTMVNRFLSNRVLVGVGLISYSAYLWHHALFALGRHWAGSHLAPLTAALLVALTLLLAWLSWRYVERPFRNHQRVNRRLLVTWLGGATGLILLATAGLWLQADKLAKSGHFAPDEIEQKRELRFSVRGKQCHEKGWPQCNEPDPNKPVRILTVGDSHGIDALNGLQALLGDEAFDYSTNNLAGCPPHRNIRSITTPTHPDLVNCEQINLQRFDVDFLNRFDVIVINVLLGWYKEQHLIEYLDFLHSAGIERVIVFGSAFSFNEPLPELLNQHGLSVDLAAQIDFDPRLKESTIESAAIDYGYLFLSKQRVLCGRIGCRFFDRYGDPITYDRHHLTLVTAATIVAEYADAVTDYVWNGERSRIQ